MQYLKTDSVAEFITTLVSSAKILNDGPSQQLGRSFMHSRKRKGLNVDP